MNTAARKKLHSLSTAELTEQLTELIGEYAKKRLKRAAGKLDNSSEVTHMAKSIARYKTILRAKELEAK